MSEFILATIVGGIIGWLYAHKTIANECRKLGRFYVGESIFVCKEELDKHTGF